MKFEETVIYDIPNGTPDIKSRTCNIKYAAKKKITDDITISGTNFFKAKVYQCVSLSPTTPMIISEADIILRKSAESLKKIMPIMKVPTAPMPVQTA